MYDQFFLDIAANRANRTILSRWQHIQLPNVWLVAGCLFQTVWNLQSGHDAEQGIKDYDLFYFDRSDLSRDGEQQAQQQIDHLFGDLGIVIEVVNQARVHLWYEEFFGFPYDALQSSEEGIGKFLVRETCVGVRPGEICAPYGLEGLYAGHLTLNELVPYRELFDRKVASYKGRWPWLSETNQPSMAR
jgi:uncharacterized protein